MYQVPLATSGTLVSREAFWDSLTIYHSRPHLINRKIIVADQILFYEVDFNLHNSFNISEVLSTYALEYEVRKLKDLNRETITKDLLINLLSPYDKNLKLNICGLETFNELDNHVFLSVRIVLPRIRNASKAIELVVIDKSKDFVTFFSAYIEKGNMCTLPAFSYRIELAREGFMRITVNNFDDADTSSAVWLGDLLFCKLLKWTENLGPKNNLQSLTKVPLERYGNLYNDLKNKYGAALRKVWWEKTKTDPQKFIFEDVAIASYLICLWNEEHGEEAKHYVKFVDCGCGNGLLVYILHQEGFIGYGIDLRRRNIWDLFTMNNNADLRVGVVEPDSTFPEATWLIGNHSDELTPWLPVIALKSSPKTNYFVLPCCPFDFNGKKYSRINTAVSQYADYLEYIKNVSEICAFKTSMDKLRIPSTKRTCLVGVRNVMETVSEADRNIESFIKLKFNHCKNEFTPRSSEERVRNCTKIDRAVIDKIVKDVVNILLMTDNQLTKKNGSKWNNGGQVHLGKLSKLVPDDLHNLKKECGGLQTLLRNHRYIFNIENAEVSLRKPYKLEETSKYSDKLCWFYRFHPNGCLYDSEECGYKHNSQ